MLKMAIVCASFICGMLSFASASEATLPLPAQVQFNHDIRPILSENCFSCHGPDRAARKGKLRLDTAEGATEDIEGKSAIVPGNPEKGELYKRVTSTDYDEHMPPAKSERKLSERQIGLLKKWIEQGAKWDRHWAFIPPVRPELPKAAAIAGQAAQGAWVRNAIDNFTLARLEQEKLLPRPEADKQTLIRRLSLDLTGLPPTLAEIDAFLADTAPDAYEKLVERLLSSPHYGERMALEWLDAARFADTHGYHIDAGRDMTRWREWVIDAFNTNMPFDQFTIEQLAGDLLPNATLQQKIASGFNRNHMINFEGGANADEYHNAYLVDRVNTTGMVWMGLTVNCCQCHDHKYDPISQKEYYQLYSFFNNVPENGLDGSKGNAAPMVKSPSVQQQQKLDQLSDAIKNLELKIAAPMPEADAGQAEWETNEAAGNVDWMPLDPESIKSVGGSTLQKLDDKSIKASGTNPVTDTYNIMAKTSLKEVRGLRLEELTDDSMTNKGPGRSSNGNVVLTNISLTVSNGKTPAEQNQKVNFKSASADFSQSDFPISNAIDSNPDSGWAIHPEVGKAHTAVFETESPVACAEGAVLSIALDFNSKFEKHALGKFRLSVTNANHPQGSNLPSTVKSILALAPEKRSESQKAELHKYYRANGVPALKALTDELAGLRKQKTEIEQQIPTSMVMQEMATPRQSFILMRGQYDQHGEKVTAGVPAALPPLPKDAPVNRLGLARWLVSPGHPLTARVIVNRYWQMYFGTGLVKTAEDFGSQGEVPSHPELLDYLATEFIQNGWNVKAMQRLIVASATYRQSSIVTKDLVARDPENRLFARGARHRLSAELIRDQALAVSGLLDDRIGGASVSPYQPAGLWEELMSRSDGKNWSAQVYVQSHGADLYRRTMYTFWKRSAPPPTLSTFDAPDREVCTVRRARTNTPLQALVLMNDPTYVESARKFSERILLEGGNSTAERIKFAFRLATSRPPSEPEQGVLQRIYEQQLGVYKKDQDAALNLLKVGESPRNEKLDATELAAWTVVASTILNLDETITRE